MKHTQMVAVALLVSTLFGGRLLAKVVEIKNDAEYKKIMASKNPIIVEFAADWCGVCTNIKAQFEDVSEMAEFKHVTFARVNIDTVPQASQESGVVGIPTFLYMENGKKKNESVGVRSLNAFNKTLTADLRKAFNIAQAG